MPTPISPDPLADDNSFDADETETSPQPSAQRSALLGYSDLSIPAAAMMRERWSTLPDADREALVESLVDFAEESVEVNFNRVFRQALTDPLPRIRQLAIEGLWEDEAEDLVPKLLEMIANDVDIDVRAEAAGSLVRFTGSEGFALRPNGMQAVAMLLKVAADLGENALARRRALESLGPLAGDRRVEQLLRDAIDDDDQSIACGAIAGMGFSGEARWIPELEKAMSSDDAEMRYVAAVAAGYVADSDLVQALAELVEDDDAEVRYAAIASIGQIGGQGALRVLRNLRQRDGEDDELISAAFEEALLLTDPLSN